MFIEILLIICIVAVFDVTINKGDIYMQKAVSQRKSSHTIKNIRGIIYDRNMIGFVDSRTESISTPSGNFPLAKRYDST